MTSYAPYDLIDKEADTGTPVLVNATSLVRVVAPATLPAGYTFVVEMGGDTVHVTVPEGGVREGETFLVPVGETGTPKMNVPIGKWRDGLCDCCVLGVCHPQFCLTWWCRPLALAQVMTRVHLNWMGEYVGPARASTTFKIVLFLWILFYIIDNILGFVMMANPPDASEENVGDDENPFMITTYDYSTTYLIADGIHKVLSISFAIYVLVLAIRTRAYIRNKYAIPERDCMGCEDCCCAWWCLPCTICQMARHTADYQKYPATCCTETGLQPHAPSIV